MKISAEEAIQRLQKSGLQKVKTIVNENLIKEDQKIIKNNEEPITLEDSIGEELYIVKQGNKKLVLPSDSELSPIVGEIDEIGDEDEIPPSLEAWFGEYQREIEWYQNSEHESTGMKKAAAATPVERESVPMMIDATWSLKTPYNQNINIGGTMCVTGCNATSMALVMYYWGKKGYYRGCIATPEYKSGKTLIKSLPPIAEFDYENLTAKKPTTAAGKNAVATLMEYCGKAIKSVYGTSVTTGNIAVVTVTLKNSMRMGDAITTIYASAGATAFEEKIYKQILKKRPVIMAGWNSKGGHTFVCDGYDADKDMYHFNWGWGGSYNGWYKMSALNPYTGYTYNSNKKAVIGIQPNYIQGDTNDDGLITVTDVMNVVENILAGKTDLKTDMNYDGMTTVTDALIIVDKILNK